MPFLAVTDVGGALVPLIRRYQMRQRGSGGLFGTAEIVVHLAAEQRILGRAVEPDSLRVGSKGSCAPGSPDVMALKGIEMYRPMRVEALFGQKLHPLPRKPSLAQ